MSFQWDERKAGLNRPRHGIEFAHAVGVFQDDHAVTMEDDHPAEQRFVAIGADLRGRILVVCYTWRGDSIRVISARRATAREKKFYREKRP